MRTDSPAAFIRCNLMSPVAESGISKDGKRYWYRLADGNRFTVKVDDLTRVVGRLGYTIRVAAPSKEQPHGN